MQNLKRTAAFFLAVILTLALSAAALAVEGDTGFSDVDADSWYADAAVYCRDNGLMSGTSATTFSPDTAMTRAMLAAVLYRLAGSPAVAGTDAFTDTAAGAWYADAVLWASQSGIIGGYGGGLFGADDPVTREQLATILWRCSGSPAAEAGADYADEGAIASWASAAADWARASGYISGMDGNRFVPGGRATRAQAAAILMRYDQGAQGIPTPEPTPDPEPAEGRRVLVAYFSCTGNTEAVAEHLGAILDADLCEIIPEEPYTSADLNYSNSESRSQVEQRDPESRPAISGTVEGMEDYGVIFIGYPIWNGAAPRIISTFLESYDLSGKTIIPFCTSGSSGIGASAEELQELTDGAAWLDGRRFGGNASRAAVESWVSGLEPALPMAA